MGPLEPDFASFARLFDGERAVPVWAAIDPSPDPLLLAETIAGETGEAPFLLQSAGPVSAGTARYTIASCNPYLVAIARGDEVELHYRDCDEQKDRGRRVPPNADRRESRDGDRSAPRGADRCELRRDPVATLRELLGERPARRVAGQPPFAGGAVGFLGYDLGRHFETLPLTAVDDLGIADCCLGFYESAVVIDRLMRRAHIATTPRPASTASETYERARDAIGELAAQLARADGQAVERLGNAVGTGPCTGGRGSDAPRGYRCGPFAAQLTRPEYEDRVEAVREYIRAGDVFQVNLSHRLSADFRGSGVDLYRRLLATSPAAFAAYLRLPGVELISASPESFLHVHDRSIETRPIKGTTRRTLDARADARLAAELLASEKERAEHVMTVDLLRNDLGRACEYGSVAVRRLLEAERCPQVIHLVSTIAGRLRPGVDAVDVLRATFPGGSVTGAPKIRAMEIIEELEGRRRGPYTGAIGYLSFAGDMNLSIAIRTLVRSGDRIHLQVGGGIVADSDPAREYEETMLKASGLIAACGSVAADGRKRASLAERFPAT